MLINTCLLTFSFVTAEHVAHVAETHNAEHAKPIEQRHQEAQELKDRTLWSKFVLEVSKMQNRQSFVLKTKIRMSRIAKGPGIRLLL